MIPNVDVSYIMKNFEQNFCKPEAPWIKRCDFGIKFTEEIQGSEHGLSLTSEPKAKETKWSIPISVSEQILKNSMNLFEDEHEESIQIVKEFDLEHDEFEKLTDNDFI